MLPSNLTDYLCFNVIRKVRVIIASGNLITWIHIQCTFKESGHLENLDNRKNTGQREKVLDSGSSWLMFLLYSFGSFHEESGYQRSTVIIMTI